MVNISITRFSVVEMKTINFNHFIITFIKNIDNELKKLHSSISLPGMGMASFTSSVKHSTLYSISDDYPIGYLMQII